MRAREIILELREYMNRDEYGCWVDAKDNQIYPVDRFQHIKVLKEYLIKNHNARPNDFASLSEITLYQIGFANHLVKVSYPEREDINIEGVSRDLQKVSQILLATCAQPDVRDIYIDKRTYSDQASNKAKLFEMPADRRKLMMFLKNEVE